MQVTKTEFQNDYMNFGAMKKSQFQGFDLVCINKFKAPIEKFNSNEDLQLWASKKLTNDIFSNNLIGRKPKTRAERSITLRNWLKEFNESCKVTATESLLVFSSFLKTLSPKNDTLIPQFNKQVFKESVRDAVKLPDFNFNNIYRKN